MKRIILLLVLVTPLFADEPKKPTELSQTRLELSQARLKLSYAALQNAQSEFQKQLAEFNTQCDVVVKEVGKPAGTRCNPDNLDFIIPTPKAEVKK